MNTNEFAQTLLTWIKTLLLWIGIPHPILNKLDEIIFLVFIIIIAFAIGTAMHYITLYFTRRILKYKQIGILSSLIEYNALRKISAIIPPLIIASLLPFAFDYHSTWFIVSEKITWIYFFIALLFSVNALSWRCTNEQREITKQTDEGVHTNLSSHFFLYCYYYNYFYSDK